MDVDKTYSDYLMHHGILGQKWGIRRYQNYDGSYTRRGLERYNKAKKNYDDAKNEYRKAKNTDDQDKISSSRKAKRDAKRKLNKQYDKLATAKRIDQGHKLILEKGKTITGNNMKRSLVVGLTPFAASMAHVAVNRYVPRGKMLVGKYLPAIDYNKAAHIAIGSSAVAAMLGTSAKTFNENRKMRAYYNRTGLMNY